MKEKIYDSIIGIYIIILFLFLFSASIFYTYEMINCDFVSVCLIIFGGLGFLLHVYYIVVNKNYNIFDLIILLIYFFLIISYLFAFDKRVALKGFFSGREGILVIMSYYIFFLTALKVQKIELKNFILKLLTIYGIIQVLYGLLQVFDVEYIFRLPVIGNWKYASGFVVNSNFMGTYMTILFGLWLPRFFFKEKNKINIVDFIIMAIFLVGLLSSGAMSSFVAMIFLLIFLMILIVCYRRKFVFKVVIKKAGMFLIVLILSILILTRFTSSDLRKDILELQFEVSSGLSGKVEEDFGTGRIYIWKEAIKYFPEYIFTGIGIDNFAYLGFKHNTFIYDSYKKDTIIFKAHNEYLQILVTEGIFTFIIYLIYLFTILFYGKKKLKIKKDSNNLELSYLFAILGYLVQAFFNIRITLIAPIFFIICGLYISKDEKMFAK